MTLGTWIVFGVITALLFDFTVDWIDNGISRAYPQPKQSPARMIDLLDLPTLPFYR